jgi:DNA-cytosine methyltransferase
MSTAQIAINNLGVSDYNYYASETDKWCIKVTQDNFQNTIQVGDIKGVRASQLPNIDLLIGGSPCQGFSFAGKGLNFNDERSKLFFEFVRLLNECKPKWFLLENVVMKKEYQAVITKHLGFEPVLINSNLVSAQNRKRLYWTNIPFDMPEEKYITWGKVREWAVVKEKYYYSDKALHWIGRHGTRKNKKLKIHKNYQKMQMVEATHYKKYSSQRFFGIVDQPLFEYDGINQDIISLYPDVFPNIPSNENLRYITPRECARLQTVPDSYVLNVSDTQAYKMLGNAFTVDVISHILNHTYTRKESR